MIQTANNTVPVSYEAQVYVKDLDLQVWCGILENSPAVLSVGLLTTQEGFDFIWKNNQSSYLQKGDKRIYCTSQIHVPTVAAVQEICDSESTSITDVSKSNSSADVDSAAEEGSGQEPIDPSDSASGDRLQNQDCGDSQNKDDPITEASESNSSADVDSAAEEGSGQEPIGLSDSASGDRLQKDKEEKMQKEKKEKAKKPRKN